MIEKGKGRKMEKSLHVEIQNMGQYLVVEVSGELSLESGRELIDLVESESKKRGCDLFLVDMLQTGPPEKGMDRYDIGVYAAEKFHPGLKVAVVYRQELINKFFENTAANRGAAVTVVGSRKEALEYLLGRVPDKAIAGDN